MGFLARKAADSGVGAMLATVIEAIVFVRICEEVDWRFTKYRSYDSSNPQSLAMRSSKSHLKVTLSGNRLS